MSAEQQQQDPDERQALAHDTYLEAEFAHDDTEPPRQDAAMHRTAMTNVRRVAEELRETAARVRAIGDDEPSELVSERLERLEERLVRLEERVYQIEEQLLKAGAALRQAALGTS